MSDEPETIPDVDRIYITLNLWSNPTADADTLNYAMPPELQYPRTTGRVWDMATDEDSVNAESAHIDYQLVRCYRDNRPDLRQAQRFFDQRRITLAWQAEGAIFRTARFWCKRVYGVGLHEHGRCDPL